MTTVKRVKILAVDDDPRNITALESVLTGIDARLMTAHSGEDALKLCLGNEFALILLDVNMPGMDGYETARLIRGREGSRNVPVIFITAYDRTDDSVKQAYALGAFDFIFKPVVPEILRAKAEVFVRLYVQQNELQRRTRETALREDAARKLSEDNERLMRERRTMEGMVDARQKTTAGLYGLKALNEEEPSKFAAFVDRYAAVLDNALKQKLYKAEYNLSMKIKEMAFELGDLGCGPRDIVDIHLAAVDGRTRDMTMKHRNTYETESRFLLMELMGYLVSAYRTRIMRYAPLGN